MRGRPSPPLPAELARTITWDQGEEMACHTDFYDRLAAAVQDGTPPGS